MVSAADIVQTVWLAQALQRVEIDTGIFFTLAGANAFAAGMANIDLCAVDRLIGRIEAGDVHALVVAESDMWRRFPDRPRLLSALERLDLLIVLDYLDTPLNEKAQVFIPTRTIYEVGGHWINQEGRVQAALAVLQGGEPVAITGDGDHPPRIFDAAIPGDQPLAAWRAAAKLSLSNTKDGAPAMDSLLAKALSELHPSLAAADDTGEGRRVFPQAAVLPAKETIRGQNEPAPGSLTLLLVDRTLGTEPLSTRSPALADAEHPPAAQMHPLTIQALGLRATQPIVLSAGEKHLRLPLEADDRMAPGVVVIPRHHTLDWQIFGETRLAIEQRQIKQG
jgi:NADH-quinone oxidoreductase subunit G